MVSGKTALAVRLAAALGGEILSADSRQVYRGLDIGAGKDLDEYRLEGREIPYHLIDIAGLDGEFSVYHYQRACYEAWEAVRARHALPVLCGGSGLYLEAVLSGYALVPAPEDPELRAALAPLTDAELLAHLEALSPRLHNTTDTTSRERTIRAIEIAEYNRLYPPPPAPPVVPLVLGVAWPRPVLWSRIEQRLRDRLDAGLVEEVEGLHRAGVPWARLHTLGLEYRYVSDFLQGTIRNRNDLFQKLNGAIRKFAKRQDTWFRRMERNGHVIHWIPEGRFEAALEVVQRHGLG